VPPGTEGTHWRLGQLVLDGGRGGGRHLIAAEWIRRMQQPGALAPFYGWLMWLNPEGQAFPGASGQASFMVGAGGHYVWMEPAFDAVIVVRWLDGEHVPGFMQRVRAALSAG
jgi:CubicO group peptidase (beta-lactamase class C family)